MGKRCKPELLAWGISLASLLVTLLFLPHLPAQVPAHWNMTGEIDGYGPPLSILYLPLIALGLNLLLSLLPLIDPKRQNYPKFAGVYHMLRLILSIYFAGFTGILLYSATHPGALQVNALILAGIGLLLTFLGNYLPKIKPNYFVGVRTPWTISSETVWRKTHRLSGFLWVGGGLLMAAAGFLLHGTALVVACAVLFVIMVGIPFVFSFLAFRSEKGKAQK